MERSTFKTCWVVALCSQLRDTLLSFSSHHPWPSCWKAISVNPGLNFNPGLSISLFKNLFELIFPIFCRVSSNHIMDKKNQTEFFSLKLSNLKSICHVVFRP